MVFNICMIKTVETIENDFVNNLNFFPTWKAKILLAFPFKREHQVLGAWRDNCSWNLLNRIYKLASNNVKDISNSIGLI